MISAGDFRNGKTLEIEGTVYQILEFIIIKFLQLWIFSM